jgi:hypothetical protein
MRREIVWEVYSRNDPMGTCPHKGLTAMQGFSLIARLFPRRRRARMEWLREASRVVTVDEVVSTALPNLVLIDLGYGDEVWMLATPEVLVERPLFVVAGGRLVIHNDSPSRAVKKLRDYRLVPLRTTVRF